MKQINALAISGTDPSGGAGIQADLKTFSALGVYGCTVITALVAQNTYGVQSIFHIGSNFVSIQLDSVLSDIRIDSTKIGMLGEIDIIETVVETLKRYQLKNVVLDPVMFAKSGDILLSPNAIETLRIKLLPEVDIITPNLSEAALLLEVPIACNEKCMKEQGNALLALGCKAVLIKGGHLNSIESPDWFFTKKEIKRFTTPRIWTKNTHGTGCTLSAALAALRPRYKSWSEVIQQAKTWLSIALKKADALEVGHGKGPLHHFYEWW